MTEYMYAPVISGNVYVCPMYTQYTSGSMIQVKRDIHFCRHISIDLNDRIHVCIHDLRQYVIQVKRDIQFYRQAAAVTAATLDHAADVDPL